MSSLEISHYEAGQYWHNFSKVIGDIYRLVTQDGTQIETFYQIHRQMTEILRECEFSLENKHKKRDLILAPNLFLTLEQTQDQLIFMCSEAEVGNK